ncbi:MAG: winged helix-turn-helix transcriptional regulator [Clostridia bacterium]|nr:winged helix-turn-helix transcriptional regulator [Clostridia bacterium]
MTKNGTEPVQEPVQDRGDRGQDGADRGEVARQVSAGLARISVALRSRSWREAGPEGLSPTQGQVLVSLRYAPEGLSLRQVAEALAVTPPTASEAVRTLVAKGLVVREADPADRRAVRLHLTPAGRAVAERAAQWPDFLAGAAAELDPAEQTALLRALVKMVRTLQLRGEIQVARMCVTCRFFRPNVHADPDAPHHCDFVDAPFGDRRLRLDCPDHREATPEECETAWLRLGWSRGLR